MISKDTISEIIGIDEDDISDEVYTWAVAQFFSATGFSEDSEEKTFNKYVSKTRDALTLNTEIESIDTITMDGVRRDFTLNSNLFFNPDTGFIKYTSGFSGMVKIEYTKPAYTHTDLCDLLISLYCTKGISTFTPDKTPLVKRVKMGDYEKEFYSQLNYKDGYQDLLDKEIYRVLTSILSGDNRLVIDRII